MRIVAISDTHTQHQNLKIPDGDVLIHCGDFSGRGTLQELNDFCGWFEAQPHRYRIVVPGNHDRSLAEEKDSALAILAQHPQIILLLDSSIRINGELFYGSPWTPMFMNWHFMKPRGKSIRKVWNKIPTDTDVLITHGPPYGHSDLAPGRLPRNAGCLQLLLQIKELNITAHFFGHIHRDGVFGILNGQTRSDEIPSTTFINASICTNEYKPTNPAQVFDL